MSNPVFERMKDSRGYATFGPPGTSRSTVQDTPTYGTPTPQDLETMYGLPTATSVDTGRMTYDDVIVKTGLVFVAVLAGAAVGWNAPALWLPATIIGFVLGLVNVFKKKPSPPLIIGYGLFQGAALGAVSGFLNRAYPGIAVQAVLGTLCVFLAVLVGFRSGKLRTSPKLTKIFFIALISYAMFGVVNLLLVVIGGNESIQTGGLGLVIGAFAVLLASYSLVMDFEFIKSGVEQGVPSMYAWTAAFGLVMTLVWLYIEILRILSILRGD